MNTNLIIKNFRVFDEDGVKVEIKPLTILTGCNSSGKSTIVKAAFLLYSFMKQVSNAIENGDKLELNKFKLDFTCYPNNLLGRFDKVIPTGSSFQKVTLGYTVFSYMISQDVDVNLVFAVDKNDDLNNAYLDTISISNEDGVFYLSDKEKGNYCNLNIIKKYCPDFLKIEYLINTYCGLYSYYDGFGNSSLTEEEFETQVKAMLDILRGFGKNRVEDIARYIRSKKKGYKCIATKDKLELLDWTEQNGSYFFIPVLDYLKDIPKDDILSKVNEILASNEHDNALLSSRIAVNLATNKIITDYINSDFISFSDYFKDFEVRHFEFIHDKGNNAPCMLTVELNQNYTTSYPGRGGIVWESVPFIKTDIDQETEEEKELAVKQKIEKWEKQPLTFDMLYEVVMLWNEKYTQEKCVYYREGQDVKVGSGTFINYPDGYYHYAFGMLSNFASKLAMEIINPASFEKMSYVSSSRATVKKLYSLDEKDDFTELLHRYFEAKRIFEDKKDKSSNTPDYETNSFLNKWIKLFGIGQSLSFELDEEGLGVKIFLVKSAEGQVRLLADEGYGITQLISILLQIETAILSAEGRKTLNIWGLSTFDKYDTSVFHFEENTIAIEEPEIHLHPSYQSKLAEMFIEAYNKYNIHFMIETHSEYLIRKLQTLAARGVINSDEISILYVYSPNIEDRPLYVPQILSIGIKSDGRLTDSFGPGFFDEADSLAMEILKYTIRRK